MKTYEFTAYFTHGYATVEVTAASKAKAIMQARTKAEAFLSGDDSSIVYDSYSEAGDLETIELDYQTVFATPEVKLNWSASDLLSALEDIVGFVDDEGDWAHFPQFIAARAAIKQAKGE